MGLVIFDFRFPIANWLYRWPPIENRQLTIGNHRTRYPRGGTDLSWDRSLGDGQR
jgi:hypothetical protein